MGPNKFIHLTFALGALLVAFLVGKTGDWVWGIFAKPNDMLLTAGALVVAGSMAVVAYRNERTYAAVRDVTVELEKVSWPTRKETYAATIVVLITVVIASLILALFDAFWSKLTGWFLS